MSSLVFLLQLPPKLRTPEVAETEEVALRTPGGACWAARRAK
jgi:hypothetical protein